MDDLADCIRAWRDRLSPAAVGLPAQHNRRAPGLRREELAGLAGVSVDYLCRLEQGRASNPSPQVLGSLARALRLSGDERDHLFRAAGQAPPGPDRISQHLTPGVQRVLDRLTDVPVTVIDAGWTVVACNSLAAALLGDLSAGTGRDRNIIWRLFLGGPERIVRGPEERARMAVEAVADLHATTARYPDDPDLTQLVADLQARSAEFAELWAARPTAVRRGARKTFRHPQVGELTLDCDTLTVQGSDLRLVVYTAEPGSADAEALTLISVFGLQTV